MSTSEATGTRADDNSGAISAVAPLQGAWWKIGSGLLMAFVIYGAFFIAKGAAGFRYDGDTARVMFFHVPSAVLSSVCYFVGVFYAIRFLVAYGDQEFDAKSAIAMELGFLFCMLATITGSIFAGMQWGTFWNWDPRETSIVIMLLFYAAYLVLRGGMAERPEQRGKVSAVYAIVVFVPAQFLIWAVPRIIATNHPTKVLQDPKATSGDYKLILYSAFLAFTMTYIWAFQLRLRAWKLAAKREGTI